MVGDMSIRLSIRRADYEDFKAEATILPAGKARSG
jgi:hypothetical protein